MRYQSLAFIIYVAVVLLFYYKVGRKNQIYVLAAANLAFYAMAGLKYLPYLLTTIVATFLAGRKIDSIYKAADEKLKECTTPAEKKEVRNGAKMRAKRFLQLSLFVAIGLLAVCKYTGFFMKNLNRVLGIAGIPQLEVFRMILPLGISFYTFMAISYVLDIYWKRYEAEKNFLTYAVFVSYFPHIVQGPIDRFNEFKPQIINGVVLEYKNITFGAKLALWGFFKKLVIADRLGLFVDQAFGNWQDYDGIVLAFALAVYSIQIYADFSGCIDIVRGTSEMFGIELRQNFNHPYFSRTMAEFWRRWHISLQEWFKDYVYYPVSASAFNKNIKKKLKNKGMKRAEELFASCFPILVVWLVTGIWHGASWKFVAWGLFHASLLIGSNIFEPVFKRINEILHIDTDNFGWHFWQMARTYFLCCVGRIFFRADGMRYALGIFVKVFTDTSLADIWNYTCESFGFIPQDVTLMVVSVIILLVVDILQEKMKLREVMAQQNLVFRWILIYACVFSIVLFGIYGPGYDAASFIYEQF